MCNFQETFYKRRQLLPLDFLLTSPFSLLGIVKRHSCQPKEVTTLGTADGTKPRSEILLLLLFNRCRGLWPARLLCPWVFQVGTLEWLPCPSPSKLQLTDLRADHHNHCLVTTSCPTLCDPVDCGPPGSSVHGFPGRNTGVGCHFLLQGTFPTQGSNPCLLHWQADSFTTEPPGKPQIFPML